MESAKYTIKEAVQATQKLNFGEDTCNINQYINPICTGGGKFAPSLSYFNIAPKRKQSFALMHPDFESNLRTHIFRKFGVSRTTGSDIIFAFVKGT